MTDPTGATRATRGADGQIRAVARALDRNSQKTAELDAQVRRLAGDVARLTVMTVTDRPAPPVDHPRDVPAGDGGGDVPAVRSWLLADRPDQALTDLAELIAWMHQVYVCYPDAAIGPCWMWHPHVVEELWWLSQAHREAYDPEAGSWLRVGDWHDRQRPGVARRIRELLAKCDLSLHLPDRKPGQPLPAVPMAGYGADIAEAWAAQRGRPEPTRAQIEEATAYVEEQHRRR